jgi:hypothetical protein
MFSNQKDLALSFYDTALYEYIAACEDTCDMYADGKKPDKDACVRASNRFTHAYSRLKTVVKISNYKFGTKLVMPHLVFDIDWFENVQ